MGGRFNLEVFSQLFVSFGDPGPGELPYLIPD